MDYVKLQLVEVRLLNILHTGISILVKPTKIDENAVNGAVYF